LKFGVFGHPKRPKIAVDKIAKKLRAAKVQLSQQDPDIGIVVGGDGSFGYYGRTLDIPMLFVGVREPYVLGSQSRLAEIFYDDLGRALKDIEAGRYNISEKSMISININDNSADDILTDVYLERGIFSGCLRYVYLC
jgi:NAD+ kinase